MQIIMLKKRMTIIKNTFGRESYDNQGSPIISLAHVNNSKVKITETMRLGLVIK